MKVTVCLNAARLDSSLCLEWQFDGGGRPWGNAQAVMLLSDQVESYASLDERMNSSILILSAIAESDKVS